RCFLFFFSSRRRHTRFSRDWSSDVCSSDLVQTWVAEFHISRLWVSRSGQFRRKHRSGQGVFGTFAVQCRLLLDDSAGPPAPPRKQGLSGSLPSGSVPSVQRLCKWL